MTKPAASWASQGPATMDIPLKLAITRASNGLSPASVLQALVDWQVHLMVSPSRQLELAASAHTKWLAWLQHVTGACSDGGESCIEPEPQDKRFSRPEWQRQPFHAMAQAFLLQQQWWGEATRGVRGVSRHHEEMTAFLVRQWLDMLSPSNFIATNPRVLQETAAKGGANLASGFANWLRDAMAVASAGKPRGIEAFRPGETVAVTPGKVVMRNHLVELIQYEPATTRVYREPVLVVPSWIMKYYILDLTPEDSLVRYLVGQGHTVFILSWRNPGSEDADLSMDDYVELGVMDAMQAVQRLCPGAGIHAMGYCLGGTLLGIAAAALGANRLPGFETISMVAAQGDFSEPGELGLFIDDSQIAFLEDIMAERGYLDGRRMAGAFQLINSKDLVWSKLIHEYLMGAQTPLTPLRAWNADATRMPARMHSEYLRQLYLNNDLAEHRYRVNGRHVALHDIRTPMFLVATERDHVSPWRSVYRIHRLVDAPVTFVLASGGHNVGVVSPPGAAASPDAAYRFSHHEVHRAPLDPQEWFDSVRPQPGSWWPFWHEWLHARSGKRVPARRVTALMEGGAPLAAPGTYVFQD